MLTQGTGGHIVNITTSLVDHPDSTRPSALASLTKGGLAAVTRSLAIEYASRGVRVNAVSPGVIKTPIHDPSSYEGMADLHPLGRIGEVSDIVDAIFYLEGATFVTGEILHVDGGQAAGHVERPPRHNRRTQSGGFDANFPKRCDSGPPQLGRATLWPVRDFRGKTPDFVERRTLSARSGPWRASGFPG